MKAALKNLLDHFGIEVDRSTTLRRFLATHPIDLVVDVGANLGQFAQLVRRKGYSGRIWSFEPVSSVYDALVRISAADSLWSVSRLALGSEQGEATINVTDNHSLTSFLPPSDIFDDYSTGGPTVREMVPVDTLDRVLAQDTAQNMFLKIDVQGFEKQVLDGARGILDRVHALYIELPIDHLYDGGWSFPEAISYLDDLGFTPAQFRTVTPLAHDRASAVEFDCLFRRKSA